MLKLLIGVRLVKELRTSNEHSRQFAVYYIACCVEHAQFRPKFNGLMREFTSAVSQLFEIDVGKQAINMLRRMKMYERLINVAGGNNLITPLLDGHYRHFAKKSVIFDDKNDGHQEYARGRTTLSECRADAAALREIVL